MLAKLTSGISTTRILQLHPPLLLRLPLSYGVICAVSFADPARCPRFSVVWIYAGPGDLVFTGIFRSDLLHFPERHVVVRTGNEGGFARNVV